MMWKEWVYDVSEWCEFTDDRTYILMAVARRKFNEDITNNTEIVYRKVLRHEQHIGYKCRDLWGLISQHDLNFRIYLTVNARNTLKAYFNFRERMNSWIEDYINGDDNAIKKFGKVDSYWKSELHKPQCKDDQFFLFDVDNVSESDGWDFHESLGKETNVIGFKATPNGYHFVTEPFNHHKWTAPFEYDSLDTDGMLHIGAYRNES